MLEWESVFVQKMNWLETHVVELGVILIIHKFGVQTVTVSESFVAVINKVI